MRPQIIGVAPGHVDGVTPVVTSAIQTQVECINDHYSLAQDPSFYAVFEWRTPSATFFMLRLHKIVSEVVVAKVMQRFDTV